LEYSAVESVESHPTFRMNMPPPSSGLKSMARNITACYLLHAGFLLGLLFDPEDGGDMNLRIIG
jgi:hypothetical protein